VFWINALDLMAMTTPHLFTFRDENTGSLLGTFGSNRPRVLGFHEIRPCIARVGSCICSGGVIPLARCVV
jgi:hypothetical protein